MTPPIKSQQNPLDIQNLSSPAESKVASNTEQQNSQPRSAKAFNQKLSLSFDSLDPDSTFQLVASFFKPKDAEALKLTSKMMNEQVKKSLPHILKSQSYAQGIRHINPAERTIYHYEMALKGYEYNEKKVDKSDERIAAFLSVKQNGWDLRDQTDEMKNDSVIVLAAVSNTGFALKFAPKDLKNDRAIVLAAVSNKGSALRSASEDLKNDRAIVLAAVSNTGFALRFAPKGLKNDRAIVLAAVSNKGSALRFASEDLKNDRAIVLTAVANNPKAFQYASNELKNDKDFVRELGFAVKDKTLPPSSKSITE